MAEPTSRIKSAIRSAADPERVADIFLSAARSPAFFGDRPLFFLAVGRLSAARRPDLVERLLESSLSDPLAPSASEGFLVRVLTLYSRASMLDHAVRTFSRIASPVSDRALCALLSAYFDNRRTDLLREAFDRVPAELTIAPGVASYNVVLKALCFDGDVDAARKMLDEMPERGVSPDIVSYNEILNGYLRKQDEVAFDEFLKHIHSKGLNPNIVTYNCRISLLCAKGRTFEAEELLDAMISKGINPNRKTFNALISGFCSEGEVGAAAAAFKRMKEMENVSPNFETYIMLIRGLVGKGVLGPAVEICKECLDRKWAPPFQPVKRLIDGLVEDSQAEKAKDVVARMRKAVKGNAAEEWKKIEVAFAF